MIGAVIHEQYRILDLLGEGGMGLVYRALDTELDRQVAIKFLKAEFGQDPLLLKRFRDELRTLAGFNHPNITTLYTSFSWEGRPVMVMELVEGEALNRMIARRGPIPANVCIPLVKQALAGVGEAHRRGIIHRDLKPANLMLNRANIVKVMDFGIAKIEAAPGLTRTATTMGTPFYMAPEQVDPLRFGLQRVDARADIYAMGITLYELLAGDVPFKGPTEFSILRAHLEVDPDPPTTFYPHIPASVVDAVMRAMAKDPAKRFQSAEEFSQALALEPSVSISNATVAVELGQRRTRQGAAVSGNTPVEVSLQAARSAQAAKTSGSAARAGEAQRSDPALAAPVFSGLQETSDRKQSLFDRWFGYTGRPRLVGAVVVGLAIAVLIVAAFGAFAYLNRTPGADRNSAQVGGGSGGGGGTANQAGSDGGGLKTIGSNDNGPGAPVGLPQIQPKSSDGADRNSPPPSVEEQEPKSAAPAAPISLLTGRWSGTYDGCQGESSTHVNLNLEESSGNVTGTLSLAPATGGAELCQLQGVFIQSKGSLQFRVASCSGGSVPGFLSPTHESVLMVSGGQLSGWVEPQQPCISVTLSKM